MNSLILTAGQGTRFQPYTDRLAKPAIEFLTLPMMMYSRHYATVLGAKRIAFNLHHLPETIRKANENFPANGVEILYSDESNELLNSGGGVVKALECFYPQDHSVFISNGDNICFIDHDDLLKAKNLHESQENDVTLLVGAHPLAGSQLSALYGDSNDSLKDKGLNKSNSLKPFHFLGMMFFNANITPHLPRGAFSLFDDGLLPVTSKLKVKLYKVKDYLWYETGNPEDYLQASFKCLTEIENKSGFGEQMLNTVKTYRPDLTLKHLKPGLLMTSSPLTNSSCEGFVIVGDNCSIHNCQLKDTVIHSGEFLEDQNLTNMLFMNQ